MNKLIHIDNGAISLVNSVLCNYVIAVCTEPHPNSTIMTMDSYDKERMISIIKGVFQRHTVKLKETLEGYGSDFSDKMQEKGLIVPEVKDDHQMMMKQYMAGLLPLDSVQKIENHCRTFITILKNFGTAVRGPILDEALQLEQDIKKDVENEFVALNFLGQSNSSRLPSLDQTEPYTTIGLEVNRDSSDSKPQFTSTVIVKSDPQNPIITGSTQYHSSTCVHTQSAPTRDSGITDSKTGITMTTNHDHQTDGPIPVQPASDPTDGQLVSDRQRNVNYLNSNHELITNLKEQIKREQEISRKAQNKERTAFEEQIKYLKGEIKIQQDQRTSEREELTKKHKDLEDRERKVDEREKQIDKTKTLLCIILLTLFYVLVY